VGDPENAFDKAPTLQCGAVVEAGTRMQKTSKLTPFVVG
jgi:hypothetical protein